MPSLMSRLSPPTPPAPVDPSVVVSITGFLPERVCGTPAEAGSALWGVLRVLPIGWQQAEAFREFLCSGLAERLDVFFERRPEVELAFTLDGLTHVVRIGRAGAQ